MKRKVIALLLAMFVTGGVVGSHASQGNREVWVITSLNWEPYAGAGLFNEGSAIQELRCLLKKAGIELRVEFYPWNRARELATNDGYVGYFPAWPDEVVEGFSASTPVAFSTLSLLAKQGSSIAVSSLEQAAAYYRVGVVETYVYPEYVQLAMAQYPDNIVVAPTSESLLKMLQADRFDIAVADPSVMEYLAEKHGIGILETLKHVDRLPLVMAFRNVPENVGRMALLEELLGQRDERWRNVPGADEERGSPISEK